MTSSSCAQPRAPRCSLTKAGDVGGVEPVGVAEGVDGHHRLDQRQGAGQVVGRASGRGGHDATDRRDLVRREQPPVDRQASVRAGRPAGYDEVDRCVLRTARRPEQFRGGVPADGTAALHEQVRGPGPEDERDVGIGGDVDVREEAAERSLGPGRAEGDVSAVPAARTSHSERSLTQGSNTDGPAPDDPVPGRRCRSATTRRGLRRAAGVLSGP